MNQLSPSVETPSSNQGFSFFQVRIGRGQAPELAPMFLGTLLDFRDVEDIAHMIQSRAEMQVKAKNLRHARKVRVVNVPQPKEGDGPRLHFKDFLHIDWCLNGRNGFRSKPVEVGQVFSSALAASQHLGFNNNEVAQLFHRAKTNPDLPQSEKTAVTARGVDLAYDDTLDSDI